MQPFVLKMQAMRAAVVLVMAAPAIAAATATPPTDQGSERIGTSAACRVTTSSDSALFLDYAQGYSSLAVPQSLRDYAGLPLTHPDSVKFVTSDSLCDMVSQRFKEHWDAERGDTMAPRRSVLLVRVAPNRYVGDPAAATINFSQKLFITVDSLMNTVAVWGVTM